LANSVMIQEPHSALVAGADPDIADAMTKELAGFFSDSEISLKNDRYKYIDHANVRQRLIDATGNQWSWSIKDFQVRPSSDDVSRAQGNAVPVVVVIGTLTIQGLGFRDGIGVQEMNPNSGADAAYKGAESDALKRAAMSFGVGLKQLYIDSEGGGQGYDNSAPVQNRGGGNRQQQDQPNNSDDGGSQVQQRGGNRGGNQQQSGGDAPQQIRDPNAPASDKQFSFIESLLEGLKFDPEFFDVRGEPKMTKGEANTWINHLKEGNLPPGVEGPN